MALPNISTPEFKTKVPSTGEEITYRPFLVKEEKILLMAMEGGEAQEIQTAIMNILNNCILSNIEVDKLAIFDVEYLFLQLRGKSVGEVIDLQVTHQEGECPHRTALKLNIDDIKVEGEISDPKVMLNDEIGVMLRFPNLTDMSFASTGDDTETLFKLINRCIEYVFDSQEVYNDFTETEIDEWINSLNQTQFEKIVDFFQKSPKLQHDITFKCDACGKEETVHLEGLQSFFT